MSTTNLSTLDRIQLEIKESIQREKELKNGYHQTNENLLLNNINEDSKIQSIQSKSLLNGTNGFKKFTPTSSSTRGVMHKFLKSRGKLASQTFNSNSKQNAWNSDATFKPAKITVEKGGKPLRNGYVSAETKITRELQDFQQRESMLREERKKSHPNLMAALQLEENEEYSEHFGNFNGGLKSAKSMGNLYNNSDDGFEDNSSSAGGSLKPARSLAELCDLSDEEGGLPGTHSLVMQFENMQFKNRSSSQSSKGSFSRDF